MQITLDDPWKAAYKRQMDMYVWIMRHKVLKSAAKATFFTVTVIDLATMNSFGLMRP